MNANLEFNGLVVGGLEVSLCDSGPEKLKAYASFVLNDAIKVRNLRIVMMRDGRHHVSMPSREREDGTYRDMVHPIDEDARKWIEGVVLEAYVRECRYTAMWKAAIDAAAEVEPFSTELREAV